MSSTIAQGRNATLIPLSPEQEPELHIASLIVHTRPEALAQTRTWLLAHPGVEIHAESAQGKLVVVMESEQTRDILDLIDATLEQTGVVNAALVYHEILTPEEESQ